MVCYTGIVNHLLSYCCRSALTVLSLKYCIGKWDIYGADRVIQLARERFYWPKVESGIIHLSTRA